MANNTGLVNQQTMLTLSFLVIGEDKWASRVVVSRRIRRGLRFMASDPVFVYSRPDVGEDLAAGPVRTSRRGSTPGRPDLGPISPRAVDVRSEEPDDAPAPDSRGG